MISSERQMNQGILKFIFIWGTLYVNRQRTIKAVVPCLYLVQRDQSSKLILSLPQLD